MKSHKIGDTILITARKVSDKVQPEVRLQGLYVIKSIGTLKSGSTSLLCGHYGNSKRECRINAERFNWRVVSKGELAAAERRVLERINAEVKKKNEAEFKERCSKSYEEMKANFTWEDHVQIAFVPLILSNMALSYAEAARSWCAANRISEVKSLSRDVQRLRQDYIDLLRKDLDMAHIEHIEGQVQAFMAEPKVSLFLLQAYHTLSNEYYRLFRNVTQLPRRVFATLSRLFIDAYVRHNAKMNAKIAAKLGRSESCNNPLITDKLNAYMGTYLGEFVLPKTDEYKKIEAIVDNYIKSFEFELDK
jgi:hypothetical protein